MLCLSLVSSGRAQSLSGKFSTPMLGAVPGATLQLRLSQTALQPGTFFLVPETIDCYTTSDGSVVGAPDPEAPPEGYAFGGTGTLPAGTYYATIAYTAANGKTTLSSPEAAFSLTPAGEIVLTPPARKPASATGYAVYLGTEPGQETLQGTVAGWSNFTQSTPLTNGAAPPTQNTTACTLAFNDTILPTGTYYIATLSDRNGNIVPGFPQNWYLAGGGANVATLEPLASSPAVSYPMRVVQDPRSPQPQSVNSSLDLNGHALDSAANVGPGFYGAFWAGSLPAAGNTIATWTPNSAIELRRLDINAQTAGAGGTSGDTIAISDGTSTCIFSGLLAGSATSASALPQGLGAGCGFAAGVPLTVRISADDHTSEPANVSWSVEMTAQ